jgi:hypothetical protein
MNILTSVSPAPPHTETAQTAGRSDDVSHDLLEVVGGVAASIAGVVGAFSAGPGAVAALPGVVGSVAPIGGGTLLATALAAGPAAVGALPAMACSPELGALAVVEGRGLGDAPSAIESFFGGDDGAGDLSNGLATKSAEMRKDKPIAAKPELHDLSITKVVDKASNPMMLVQAGAGLMPEGGLHPAVESAARLAFNAARDRTS